MNDTPKNNPLDDLNKAVERDVEIWDPEVDAKLAGQVTEIGSVTTQYGTSPTVNVLTADGREVQARGFGAVLHRILSSPDIEPGDLLALRYTGKTQPRSGQQAYRDFRHVLRCADGSPKGRRTTSDESVEADVPVGEPPDEISP